MITTPNSINTMRKIEIVERLVINVIDECGLTKKKEIKKKGILTVVQKSQLFVYDLFFLLPQ